MNPTPIWTVFKWMVDRLHGRGGSSYNKQWGKWHYGQVPVDRTGFYRGCRIYHGNQASDGSTFVALNTWYAKDKHRVYFCDTERDSREYWSIKRIVIKVVACADPASFHIMSDGYTARDRYNVFNCVDIVPIRDVASYELLEHEFSKDKASAYYHGNEIAGSDAASFSVLDAHYAKDNTRLYFVDGFYIGGSIKNAQTASLRVLGNGYAKTHSQVFHQGKLMANADADSFAPALALGAEYDATDRTGRFTAGSRVKESL